MKTRLLITVLWITSFTSCSTAHLHDQASYRIQSGNDLTLLMLTDIHYLSKELTGNGPAYDHLLTNGDGKLVKYSNEMMQAFTFESGMKHPSAVIIGGDLTNNGEKQSHLDLARHLKALEKNTGAQVYVIPGNHDLLNPWARQYKGTHPHYADAINAKQFRTIYKSFGYAEAVLKDEDTLSYLAAPSEELWLLMLDTSQYHNNKLLGRPQLGGRIPPSTLKWIETCSSLAAQNGAHLIAVMHHSLLDHNELLKEGFTVDDNKYVIDTLLRNGITIAFSGHIHMQDIQLQQHNSKPIYDVASSALSVYPHQYGILSYAPANRTLDYKITKLNMELWSKSTGLTNPELLHFNHYSRSILGLQSANRSLAQLKKDHLFSGYTSSQLQVMAEFIGQLNQAYFSGFKGKVEKANLMSTYGYKLWLTAPACALKDYVLELTRQDGNQMQQLHLQLPEK